MLDTNTRINEQPVIAWLPRGQTVAAQVPYTKRKQEWIVASVVSWNEDEMTYVVKDEFPENKKMKSWTIPLHKVIRFPRDMRDPLLPGDRVLSLWYIPDNGEWSSMFYEATVVNAEEVQRTNTIWLRFNGDDEVYEIDSMKIVKPKRRSKIPKRPYTTGNGSSSPLHSPHTDVFDDSRTHHRLHASPPDQPPVKKQRIMKMEVEDQHHSPPSRNGLESSPSPSPSPSSSTTTSSSSSSSFTSPSHGKAVGQPNGTASSTSTSTSTTSTAVPNGARSVVHEAEPPQHTPVSAAVFNNRYQFCGVLGKKMKRMGAILNERSKVSNT